MILKIVLDSSMVEHSAVNRVVAGSSPARGVGRKPVDISVCGFFLFKDSASGEAP